MRTFGPEAGNGQGRAGGADGAVSPLWGVLAGGLTLLGWVASMPPFPFAEAAYVAFVPLLLWLHTGPPRRLFWTVALGTGWLAWIVLLFWLRHVTWVGMIGLGGILGAFFALWLLWARTLLPVFGARSFAIRVAGYAGLAGGWVVLEWMRSWFLWGFPWAPLALSQWERPVVLQIAAWTGAYGVSFLLVVFNASIAETLRTRVWLRGKGLWANWFSPDLYLALALLGFCFVVFFRGLPDGEGGETAGVKFGVVQPYTPPELKWDTERERENLRILERQTRFVGSLENEVLLWPEAATPWPVLGRPEMRKRVERLVRGLGRPLLMGNLAIERGETDRWYNGAFVVYPDTGLEEDFYAKRQLVPFGEFVPPPFGFIDKFVPVGGNFTPGEKPGLLTLKLSGRTIRVGPLVCYEDVFPRLSRASVRAGAELLFVTTNNAWYGEEGGAEQHAAHSVLRAVENRRPVVRAGNGGWSGWIDAGGNVRDVLRDENGSIYFRGGGVLAVSWNERWRGRETVYTRFGDWWVAVSAVFALAAGGVARNRRKRNG